MSDELRPPSEAPPLTEADVRRIVREEIAQVERERPPIRRRPRVYHADPPMMPHDSIKDHPQPARVER